MSANSFFLTLTPATLTPLALALANHLWQSTLVAGIVGLLTLTLRRNHARTRYALWLVASMKFLVPFSLFMTLGGQLASLRHSTPQRQATAESFVTIEQISQPFTNVPNLDTIQRPAAPLAGTSIADRLAAVCNREPLLPVILAAAWLIGFLVVVARWTRRWRRISAAIQLTVPLREGREFETLRRMERLAGLRRSIELRSLPVSMEPGIFGFFRPILLWPRAITGQLDDTHLEAVLAHEVCHVRRRDNLTAAIHMVVEALFWFHPLVWWLETRLVQERESACDEEVLLLCGQRRVYAESILKVCELCLESPLTCISGITGADLKHRIVQIMTATIARKLGTGAKLLLLAVGLLAVSMPIMLGQMKGAQRLSALKLASSAPSLPRIADAMQSAASLPLAMQAVPDPGSFQSQGQTTAKPPKFDAVAIRPAKPANQSSPAQSGSRPKGDGLQISNESLSAMVSRAYMQQLQALSAILAPVSFAQQTPNPAPAPTPLTDPKAKQAAYDAAAGYAQKGLTAPKPSYMDDATYKKVQAIATPIFYNAIGIAALNKKDTATAIDSFKKELASVSVTQTQVVPVLQDTYDLALAYLHSPSPDFLDCAFYAARFVDYAPEPYKSQGDKTGRSCYKKFHGDEVGYDAFLTAAKDSITPPDGLFAAVKPAPTPTDRINNAVATTPNLTARAH